MRRIGPHPVIRAVGGSEFAEVFEAWSVGEAGFRRRVVIKRLRPERRTPTIDRLFFDEARTLGHLHHANVRAILNAATDDGVPYQVLEWIDGVDAATLFGLARGESAALREFLAVWISKEIALALGHVHRARDEEGRLLGIVHRDVKSSNILVSWDGDVKLTDFGVARAANREEETLLGETRGTSDHMSPEQAMGRSIDPRSDIFSLGCTLHDLLVGKSPLCDARAIERVLLGADPAIDPTIPEDLRAIIGRATRHARDARHSDAAELESDLGDALAARSRGDARATARRALEKLRPQGTSATRSGRLDRMLDGLGPFGATFHESPEASTERSSARRDRTRVVSPSPSLSMDASSSVGGSAGSADDEETLLDETGVARVDETRLVIERHRAKSKE